LILKHLSRYAAFSSISLFGGADFAYAQHTGDNAVTSAEDAFGTVVGREDIGIYSDSNVRGFSPGAAGNFRIEGLYFDNEGCCSGHLVDSETIRVGVAAQGYAFPAPTGIADLKLKSSGEQLIVSPTLSADSLGSLSSEVDAAIPLAHGLSAAFGIGAYHNRSTDGGGSEGWNISFVPRWKPARNIELVAFFDRNNVIGQTSQPTYVPVTSLMTLAPGDFLPPRIPRDIYPGPGSIKSNSHNEDFGLVVRADFDDWSVRAGLFRSLTNGDIGISNLIYVQPNGVSGRQVSIYPLGLGASWSGEFRVTRRILDGPRQHRLTFSLRGRDIVTTYGNSAYGNTIITPATPIEAPVSAIINFPKPPLSFAPLTKNLTHQETLGISYGLNWKGLGEISIGALRTHYIKDVATPCPTYTVIPACVPDNHSISDLWLPSLSMAAPLAKGLAVYTNFVKGLEDAGTAPSYAVNANQLLPAIHSRQWDAGIRWALGKKSTLILGYYDIAKPYFDVNTANVYGILGEETHRGLEVSLTTIPAKGLTVVAGGVFSRPRVVAAANVGEVVGSHPVNQPDDTGQINVNYDLDFVKGVSLDTAIDYFTRQATTLDNAVFQHGAVHLGLGVRYKFTVAGKPFTLHVSGRKLTNQFYYFPIGSGFYRYNSMRHMEAYLTADF